jgi:lipopolysaccharide biosynthesis regulator YciM
LVAVDFASLARQLGRQDVARALMQERFDRVPSLALLRALLTLDAPTSAPLDNAARAPALGADGALGPQATPRLVDALTRMPSLSAAALLLRQPAEQWGSEGLEAVRQAVERAARPVQRYRCAACGFEAQHYFWQCPGCLGWDTFPPRTVEEL